MEKSIARRIFTALSTMLLLSLIWNLANAQTTGIIYRPSTSEFGRSILDPNRDGFVSATSAGFSGGIDYGTASELRLFPLPVLEGEPDSDLSTGANGGHTDLVSSHLDPMQSSYLGIREVEGVKYLIARIRLGGASTATKGYSILIDTDGNFAPGLLGSNNPGFNKEITLETGNAGKVGIYTHTISGSTLSHSYTLGIHHQRSIAASTVNANADYFYDFFVPLNDIGIGMDDIIRLTATTITSAQSGITGTISDFNGIDDKKYGNNRTALMMAVINTFPGFTFNQLADPNFSGFGTPKTLAPTINTNVLAGSNQTVSGTSSEANGTEIILYRNGSPVCTTTVNNGTWSCSGLTLAAGDLLTATAEASGKSVSDLSTQVVVPSALQDCYVSAPVITGRISPNTNAITGTWSGDITPDGSNVRIQLYEQVGAGPDLVLFSHANVFVPANGSWQIATGLNNTNFNNTSFLATAIIVSNSCQSGYSNVSVRPNGSSGIVAIAPTVITDPIYQSFSTQPITFLNNHSADATIIVYVNGTEVTRSSSAIATNSTVQISIPGLMEGDKVSARAQGTGTGDWLSNVSNIVTVQLNNPGTTSAPEITGTYYNGSGQTVTGVSFEPPGTVITLYQNGVVVGTAVVTGFYTWEVTGLNLQAGDVLTAYAKAEGKTISPISNSVTVLNLASRPQAPQITGSYFNNDATVNGTDVNNSNGTITLYVDGEPIATTPHASPWSITGLAPGTLFKGAKLTATNTSSSGEESPLSNEVVVAGIVSFKLAERGNSAIPTSIVSGDIFEFEIQAKDAPGGNGSVVAPYNGTPTVIAEVPILKWEGHQDAANNGTVGTNTGRQLALGGSGNNIQILVIDSEDPTAFGVATIDILRAYWKGRSVADAGTTEDAIKHDRPNNWTHSRVPFAGADIAFDTTEVLQDMFLDDNYSWGDIDFSTDKAVGVHGKNIVLGSHTLQIRSISNRGNSYFVTNGTGSLVREMRAGETMFFPVGPSSAKYRPVTIENTGESDTFALRITDGLLDQATSGNTFSRNHVQHTWFIDKGAPNVNGGVNLTFSFPASEISATINNPTLIHFKNGIWNDEVSLGQGFPAEDNGFITVTFNNYTGTFSPFGVSEEGPLPISLVSFDANCLNQNLELTWSTATEINNEWFVFEASNDMQNWTTIHRQPGSLNSSTILNYSAETSIHPEFNRAYIRLKQIDTDGTQKSFSPVRISCKTVNPITLVPNPARQNTNAGAMDANTPVLLMDAMGNVRQRTISDENGNASLNVSNMSPGLYWVQGYRFGTPVTSKLIILAE
jgi:hypothetical protein